MHETKNIQLRMEFTKKNIQNNFLPLGNLLSVHANHPATAASTKLLDKNVCYSIHSLTKKSKHLNLTKTKC